MKIYTRTGDDGSTGLFGGERVSKDHPRVQAYGTVDEANAVLGTARSWLDDADLDTELAWIQSALFDLGADLATPPTARQRSQLVPIEHLDVVQLETAIDRLEATLEPLQNFILPGGSPAAACLHQARTVVRRAEREVKALAVDQFNPVVAVFLNRLSDFLFVAARSANARAGLEEVRWQPRRSSTGD